MTEKREFIASLSRLFDAINIALANLDPDTIMYPESGWRVRDLLAHLTVWYGERIKCLRAYQQDTEYHIPDYDTKMFNHDTVELRKRRPYSDIQEEWAGAHAQLMAELEALADRDYRAETRFPWGDYGLISTLITKLVEHAEEHLAEFVAAAE